MVRKVIDLGTPPDALDGDTVRSAFQKVNQNFEELYDKPQGVTNHKDLTNLQGGKAEEYFHLTGAERAAVQNLGTSSSLNVGTMEGTVAAGNDPRLLHGEEAYNWGDHGAVGYALGTEVEQLQRDLSSKVDSSSLNANLIVYPTTKTSDLSGYKELVSDIHEDGYDTTEVDLTSPELLSEETLIEAFITKPGVLFSHIDTLSLSTLGQVRASSSNVRIALRFRVFKYDESGTETQIAESGWTDTIEGMSFRDSYQTAFLTHADFTAVDRLVIKYYGKRLTTTPNSRVTIKLGGDNPTRTMVPVPITAALTTGGVSLHGPATVFTNQSATYQITDYNSFSVYAAQVSAGTVAVSGDTVIVSTPVAQQVLDLTVSRDGVPSTFKIPLQRAGIAQPVGTSPASGATSVGKTPTLVSDAFQWVGLPDSHAATDWQVSRALDFSDIVFQSLEDTVNKTSINTSNLPLNETLYWRVRYRGGYGNVSSWSAIRSFDTVAGVTAPTLISPVNGSQSLQSPVTLSASAFAAFGNPDNHASTTWQVATDVAFTKLVVNEVEDTENLLSIELPSLALTQTYYWRVRYIGEVNGESAWSVPFSFDTNVGISTPVLISPADHAESVGKTITLVTDTFGWTGASDIHQSSDWEIATDQNFNTIVKSSYNDTTHKTSIEFSGLSLNETYFWRVKHRGALNGESSWSPVRSFDTNATVKTPNITTTTGSYPTTLTIQTSGFVALGNPDSHDKTDWELATDSGFNTIVKSSYNDSSNKTSYQFSGLALNKNYYVRVRYHGIENGVSPWSLSLAFDTIAGVSAPSLTSPTNQAENQRTTLTLTAGAFNWTGVEDTHKSSDWQIATDSQFNNIVDQSIGDTTNKTSIEFSGLTINTVYYWRVRYEGNNNSTSPWSSVYSFNTNAGVSTPTLVSPSDGAQNQKTTVTLTAAAFEWSGVSDTHDKTDWEVATDQNFTEIVKSSYNNTVDKTFIEFGGLAINTVYYWRVKYYGVTNGASSWSAVRSFDTDAGVEKPTLTSPLDNAQSQPTVVTLSASNFNWTGVEDTHAKSDWEVATDEDFDTDTVVKSSYGNMTNKTSIEFSGLSINTVYYWRVRYYGVTNGVSEWSNPFSFNTNAGITTPTLVSPANGASNQSTTLTFTASSFNWVGVSDTHDKSDWEVATDTAFSNVVKSSYGDSINKTFIEFSGLNMNETYYWRVKYYGVTNGASSWSSHFSFNTNVGVTSPTLIAPVNNKEDQLFPVTLTTSAFSYTGPGDTHQSTDWQVATDDQFNNVVKNVVGDTTNKTSLQLTAADLSYSTVYYWRARHNGANYGASEWSPTFKFTTVIQSVLKPSNESPVDSTTDVGETPELQGSAYLNTYGAAMAASQWQVSESSGFGTTVVNTGDVSVISVKYTVPAGNLEPDTKYYWRVRYKDVNGIYSNWSEPTSFTTAESFGHYIDEPAPTPSIGTPFEGGFYTGMIWNQLVQSSTSMAIATGKKTFTVPDMSVTPIVYQGQMLEIRSRANPDNKFIGTVDVASGTQLTLDVTSISGSGTFSDWSVMSRYRIITSPKAQGEHAGIALKNANTEFPSACQTLTEGWLSTLAMVDAGNSTTYPAAHWVRGLNINGKTDWYIPARDERELQWRNLKPTTDGNYVTANRPTGASFDYKRNGSYGDVSNTHGLNNNSYPRGAAYTASVPAQTSVAAFKAGGTEAFEYGSASYWSSSEYSATYAWYQFQDSSYPGRQYSFNKNYSYRVRAVRRSII